MCAIEDEPYGPPEAPIEPTPFETWRGIWLAFCERMGMDADPPQGLIYPPNGDKEP